MLPYLLIVLSIIVVVICAQRLKSGSENFAYPGATRCTDGCIMRPRNSSVYVDQQCPYMCIDQWTPAGYQRYLNDLKASIQSGAFIYSNGLLG